MIADKMQPSTLTTGEGPQLPIPSRSSSIARTRRTCKHDKYRTAARYSLFEDSSNRVDFQDGDPNAVNMRAASSRPLDRTQSPPGVDRRPMSCTASLLNGGQPSGVQRWAGLTRSVGDWDGLRKVSEDDARIPSLTDQ